MMITIASEHILNLIIRTDFNLKNLKLILIEFPTDGTKVQKTYKLFLIL